MEFCRGYAKNPVRPCSNQATYADGYCRWHVNQCRLYKLDGVKCVAHQRPGFLYCRADHDPAQRQFYVNPNWFRLPDLRAKKTNEIIQRYNHSDVYHRVALPSAFGYWLGSDYELDHKFELQAAAHAVREARIYDTEELNIVIKFLRDDVLNDNANLCFTRQTTNAIKGTAVTNLLEDLRMYGANVYAFTDYLLTAAPTTAYNGRGTRLSRMETSTIRNEVQQAILDCQYKLDSESDTPSFARVNWRFQAMRIAMLH